MPDDKNKITVDRSGGRPNTSELNADAAPNDDLLAIEVTQCWRDPERTKDDARDQPDTLGG